MEWKMIEGYLYPYRVNDQGVIQKQNPNGKWQTIKAYPYRSSWKVRLRVPDGATKRVSVAKLVTDAFVGKLPDGMLRAHRNGMIQDNAIENIVLMTKTELATRNRPWNCRPVLQIDANDEVVAIYSSATEAAKANYISKAAMSRRCRGEHGRAYELYGYRFEYEDKVVRRRRKKS